MNLSSFHLYICICVYLCVVSLVDNVKSSKLLDLNPHIGPFGNCLNQIISYDNLDTDFIEFKYPVILANYLVEQKDPEAADGLECIDLKTKLRYYPETGNEHLYPHLNCTGFRRYELRWKVANGSTVAVTDEFQYTPYSWQCILHFFLYPMVQDIDFKVYSTITRRYWSWNSWLVPEFLSLFWNQAVRERDHDGFQLYEYKEISAIYRNEMFVMVLEDEAKYNQNKSDGMIKWIMESLMYVWFASVNNFRFILIVQVSLNDFTQNEIYYLQDYTADAQRDKKIINLEQLNVPCTRPNLNQEWQQCDKVNLFKNVWVVTQTVDLIMVKQVGLEMKDFGPRLTFQSFHSHNFDTNYALFNEFVRNASLADVIFSPKELMWYRAMYKRIYATIKFNSRTDYFVVKSETFKFVTCDGIKTGNGLSFKGFISSFDSAIWLSILASFVLVTLCLKLIYKVKQMKVDLWLMALQSILEQGDPVASNEKKVPSVYFVCGAWILMTIVLSNAYKGNNISDLTAPMQIEKIILFSDLVAENYKLISKCRFCENVNQKDYYYSGSDFDHTLIYSHIRRELVINFINLFSRSQLDDDDFMNREFFLVNVSNSNRTIYAHEIGREKERRYIGTLFPIMFVPKPNGNNTIFDHIVECNKSAYGDWSDEIDLIEMKLKLLHSDGNKISKSQDGLWNKKTGWIILNTFNPRFKDRLKLFVQFGIVQIWKSVAHQRGVVSKENTIIRLKHESEDNVKGYLTG